MVVPDGTASPRSSLRREAPSGDVGWGPQTRFASLQPPTDLGAARSLLRSLAVDEAGRGPIVELAAGALDPSPGAVPDLAGLRGVPGPVVVADTVLWRAGRPALAALARELGRGRVLLFLEPTVDAGWRRAVHRLGRPLWWRSAGHHFDADVPAELRATGLVVTDLNRFAVGRLGLRSYAIGRAERLG